MHNKFPYDIYGFSVPSPAALPAGTILNFFPRRRTQIAQPKVSSAGSFHNRVDEFDPSKYAPAQKQPQKDLYESQGKARLRPVSTPRQNAKHEPVPLPAVTPQPRPTFKQPNKEFNQPTTKFKPFDAQNVHVKDPGISEDEDHSAY